METMYEKIWRVLEADPGKRGLTLGMPRPDLKKLGESLLNAGTVLVVTGFPVQRAGGVGETDGPAGAVQIARALELLGKRVLVVTDDGSCAATEAALAVFAPKSSVICIPQRGAEAVCRRLLARERPSHVIAIERPGKGADGHYHNARGQVIDALLADTDALLDAPDSVTVGIGDGGNELGMGALRTEIEQKVANGALVCADRKADFTLTAGVSNWWGWGLCAVLTAMTGKPLMPTDAQEHELLEILVGAGCVDGITGERELTVDHLSLEENLSILRALRQAVVHPDYAAMEPCAVRRIFRQNAMIRPTAGMCAGYAQCNLIVLPQELAADFREFAKRNPFSCPVLEESAVGSRRLKKIAQDVDLARDFPKYRIWKDGEPVCEPADAEEYWREDLVAFLIGCSFSFEDALQKAGIPCRHIEEGKNVPMFRTNVDCAPYGAFSGKMVVSMRPMTPAQAELARQITAQMPRVHGAPICIGKPEEIGVRNVMQPDFGDAVSFREGEIPVFWPCGVTPQSVVMEMRPPFAITHAPGHMLIVDTKNQDFMRKKD